MKLASFADGRHDANVCLYDSESNFFQYFKAERIVGIKHHGGKKDFLDKILREFDFTPDHIAFEGGNGNTLYTQTTDGLWEVDHHYAHILSAWPLSTTADWGVAADGIGQNNLSTIIVENPFDLQKAKFTYRRDRRGSFGGAFSIIGLKIGLNGYAIDHAGKLMGLQAYGAATHPELLRRAQNISYENIFEIGTDYMPEDTSFTNETFLDWIATHHEIWRTSMLALFEDYIPKEASVIFSGGSAQNTVTNDYLADLYPNLTIVPHCYDGGLSLGSLAFLCLKFNQPFPVQTGFPYWQNDNEETSPSEDTIKAAAQALADGKIIGWYQGRGELGPRALGNRSILMHPGLANGKDKINEIKRREHWRPFAPSVLNEYAPEWFDINLESPYMLRAVQVKKDKQSLIPSVTHVDGTSRIQTVTRDNNELYYKLIGEFYKLTDIPLLLNTSLNIGGKPIAGSRHDAMHVFQNSKMDQIYLGDTTCSK